MHRENRQKGFLGALHKVCAGQKLSCCLWCVHVASGKQFGSIAAV